MMVMEFDELKKVWDKQNEKPMYTMDEQALYGIITRKKKGAIKKARLMEFFLVGANLLAGGTVIIAHILKESNNIYAFLMGSVMVITAFTILFYRSRRLSKQPQYERSVHGDVEHGLSDAKYVVRMSRTMQYYFMVIGLLMIFAKGFDDWTKTILVIAFIGFTLYASTWEHKWYVRKYNDLKNLKKVLEDED